MCMCTLSKEGKCLSYKATSQGRPTTVSGNSSRANAMLPHLRPASRLSPLRSRLLNSLAPGFFAEYSIRFGYSISTIPFFDKMTSPPKRRCTFYDMKHSNNAARIRLWLRLNKDVLDDVAVTQQVIVETKWLSHDDIESDSFASVNPLKKVPALIVHDQQDTPFQLFESSVIMGYLEDIVPKSVLKMTDDNSTAEDRALVSLIVRCHDLYIASPNCTQPNCIHSGKADNEHPNSGRQSRRNLQAAALVGREWQIHTLFGR